MAEEYILNVFTKVNHRLHSGMGALLHKYQGISYI